MFRNLVKAIIPARVFRTIEPYGHLAEAIVWQTVMAYPAAGLKVIGVTGTDGKTTTATMIYAMLNDAGIKTGLMTTIGYGTPAHWRENVVHMTTMPTHAMLERIKELKAEGIEWLVLETTSHALAQNRVWGIDYSLAVMTNVTHEHLDYHGTFERYRAAKRRLFEMAAGNKRGVVPIRGIINGDDPSADYMAEPTGPNHLRYSLEHGDIAASNVRPEGGGSAFTVTTSDEGSFEVRIHLPGTFNVSNALAAVGVGMALDLENEAIAKGLAALKSVEGRMNAIDEGQDFAVIVDFAHTPDSFEKILSSMRATAKGRLIVMFGSAGRRDEAKRGQQGHSAGKWADVVVVTEEDDRDVDGQGIMDQIAGGASQEGKVLGTDLFMVHDRTEAIRFAIGQARAGDTVMLLGKGHEKTIEGADGERPWDEAAAARAAIAARLAGIQGQGGAADTAAT
ncbi:MAG TPA: UDP-N-acetylmuramoyl-L-alanyl-D-glutamate--2,6-diaminopimelate ligase [Candidatus Saccharimonadia bacterium]|nr:UDP-N-acetylmuramoyl-L-alanyl-D-glutamate--2,6-diaminopimelate ligase [Candidatus Saccharimonadia bacterium]